MGAGAAGLAAARRVAEGGARVLVLEARDRLGGRIFTDQEGLELGAEFIHGLPTATLRLLEEGRIRRIPAEGEHWTREGERFEPMQDRLRDIHRLLGPAAALDRDQSVREYLRGQIQRDASLTQPAESLERLVEQFDAADSGRASIRAILAEWTGDANVEAPQGRPEGGYRGLVSVLLHLLNRLGGTIRPGAVVRRVHWSPGGVELLVERGGILERVRGRRAIITLPLGVLQAAPGSPGAVDFDPPLVAKASALSRLEMGAVLKVMVRVPSRPWASADGGRYRDAAFFHGDQVPFRTMWTTLPVRSPWLSLWLAGPRAATLSRESHDRVAAGAIESVRMMFRGIADLAGEQCTVHFHNWQQDPRSLGGYSYVAVDGSSARDDLAAPLDGVLFFAGEATEGSGEASTVAGALMTGQRAADELLEERNR